MKKKQKIIVVDNLVVEEDAYRLAKRYCGKELVHGIPHINRMLKNFRLLEHDNQSINKGGKEILDAVEFAVILHDIGKKKETKKKKHGICTTEILNNGKNKSFFQGIPNYKWVEYAITGHTDGDEIKKIDKEIKKRGIKDSKKICLTLLLALDNIDAIGKIGVYRDYKDMRGKTKKNKPKRNKSKFKWLPDDKNNSFLERLLTNYYYIKGNFCRIKKMKSKIKITILLKLYKKLKSEQEKHIFKLIKEEKLKITEFKIKKVLTSPDFCK